MKLFFPIEKKREGDRDTEKKKLKFRTILEGIRVQEKRPKLEERYLEGKLMYLLHCFRKIMARNGFLNRGVFLFWLLVNLLWIIVQIMRVETEVSKEVF